MEAFAQSTPPRNARELAGFEMVLKFLAELTAIVTSSTPSTFNIDHPSSLNPLTASLNPLKDEKSIINKNDQNERWNKN